MQRTVSTHRLVLASCFMLYIAVNGAMESMVTRSFSLPRHRSDRPPPARRFEPKFCPHPLPLHFSLHDLVSVTDAVPKWVFTGPHHQTSLNCLLRYLAAERVCAAMVYSLRPHIEGLTDDHARSRNRDMASSTFAKNLWSLTR